MSVTLGEIRGLTDSILKSLKKQGVTDTTTLLEVTRTPQRRDELSASTGLNVTLLLQLARRADLTRIKGIGRVYCDLLEEINVNTVKDLARQEADDLHPQLIKVNAVRQFTQRPPSLEQIRDFVAQAKALPDVLEE
jgi:predicted flap endonuclease-1-like 5' DNA nuclease